MLLEPRQLRECRLALRLSQAELSRVLGVTRNSLARWERGDLPIRHPELVALALDNLANQLNAPADIEAGASPYSTTICQRN
jgi:transcriptional regulator with XRE-family HTH domain